MTDGVPARSGHGVPARSQPSAEVEPRRTGGKLFWAGVVVGWAVMAAGVRGLLHDHQASNPRAVGRLFVQAALVHDLLLAPLVCALGLLVGRLLEPPLRSLVAGGLIASGLVGLYSFPFVRGYGRSPTNPSALPLNYGRGLAVVLVGIWVVVGGLAAWALRRRRATRG